jgi:hypothetical protein
MTGTGVWVAVFAVLLWIQTEWILFLVAILAGNAQLHRQWRRHPAVNWTRLAFMPSMTGVGGFMIAYDHTGAPWAGYGILAAVFMCFASFAIPVVWLVYTALTSPGGDPRTRP